MNLFWAIKPILNMKAKDQYIIALMWKFRTIPGSISTFKCINSLSKLCVKGRHEEISQCKFVNENIGDGLHLGVSIDNVKNQHITKYESEADQNGEGCHQRNFRSRAT